MPFPLATVSVVGSSAIRSQAGCCAFGVTMPPTPRGSRGISGKRKLETKPTACLLTAVDGLSLGQAETLHVCAFCV